MWKSTSRAFRICMAKGGRESLRLSYGRPTLTLVWKRRKKLGCVQFGHKQFENPSKIPIVVTVKAKGYSQLEYILHLFLKITISAYYNYLQVKIIFLSNMEPVYLLLPPWQVSPNWGRTHCGTNTSIQSLNTHFQPLAFLNQTSSRSSYHSDQEDSIIN